MYENTSGWLMALTLASWQENVRRYKGELRNLSSSVLENVIHMHMARQSRWQRFQVLVGLCQEDARVQAAKDILAGRKLIGI